MARVDAEEVASSGDRVRFDYERPLGDTVEGIVIRLDGEVVAFANVCPHLGYPLDARSGDFLGKGERTLVCDSHGAQFEADTGRCTAGPCQGDRLETFRVEEEDDEIVILRGRSLSI